MAIDTNGISSLYDALSEKSIGTMKNLFDNYSITDASKATVISNTINSLLQISTLTVQNQPSIDKDIEVKGRSIAIQEAQSVKDIEVKTAQIDLIIEQKNTEIKKQDLTVRQNKAYDDNLRIKEGELLSNVVGMFGAGGTTLPDGLETTMLNAINAITP